ncbi:MAG TPA: hypothetical protein PKA33_08595 [Amaricoccus sp.]|uniref:hypothetical protein n=1 Tax=Amaricoccus sp. TaxID=1872485 RepID=UPI002C635407|nr:hypothetical protein [Amaricoccus sp.]HMQ94810.1 hypothetical protein [Amaricoccus sp.]HMR52434.1 hypothetical protein [Amaricoccus sp.]HMT99410.1 hypothetical protein [Amaricoccus sp.]
MPDLTSIGGVLDGFSASLSGALEPIREFMRTEPGSIGAIDADVPRRQVPFLDMLALFSGGLAGHDDALEAARTRLRDLGIAELLDPGIVGHLTPGEVADRVRQATGARCDARSYDAGENETFFLFAFAIMHHMAFVDRPVESQRIHGMIQLGRLLEWWRWRRLGLDQMVVREKTAAANRLKGAKMKAVPANRRRAIAHQLARRIKTKRTKAISARELAREVQASWPANEGNRPSYGAVRNYLEDFVAKS